ncbi:hypothetical protein NDU88_001347 [Pleurodeles waltl]|uniref:Uncharacterized protein n=1 Tax=Pleurodeles waltl TaxID=8319 RepID=A0AAV7LFR0_PLEWA|nr:hypothetical protein NDU88_001347 [Pleurodeles waltl]
MRAASDGGTPAYIRGNYPLSDITRRIGGVNRSSLGDLGNPGHNGRGFLVWTFVIVLAPRGNQRRMAPKAARGRRLKTGPQVRRPLDPQPLVQGGISRNSGFGNAGSGENVPEGRQPAPGSSAALGQTYRAKNGAKQIEEKEEVVTIPRMFKILHNSAPIGGSTTIKDFDTRPIRDVVELTGYGDSTGPGHLVSSDSGGLLQVKTDVGSRFLDTHQTVSCIAGRPPPASVSCVGGNGLAAAFEGEIDQSLYAPGSQSNVGLAQEVVTGAGYCEQAAAATYLLPSTDPPTLACTLEVIRDYRQGREDSLAQGEVGENFFSLSDQSQDSDEDSISLSTDSETCDSSTAPLTSISVLRGIAVKCQSKQTEVSRLDKAGESSEKRGKKKKKVSRTRAMSWDYTETQQLLHSMGDLSVAPAQTEVNVLNAVTAPPSPSLHLIYQTITSQHNQTQRDSKKARVATKQLQVAISKVAKTCSEIGERIAAIECRADVLESDLGAVTKQAAMHETQLSDIQWKVEDFENRQRRNNLRLIGIQEAMSVARCCIASDWLESTPPTFNHWLARMCSMFYLEMGSYACKGRGRRRMGEAIWAPFAQWLGFE